MSCSVQISLFGVLTYVQVCNNVCRYLQALGFTSEPLMIDFTLWNQTLCDFTHSGTPCVTPSLSAALPVPCLPADEVTVDYAANLKEGLMKSIHLLPWKPDSLPLDSPLWEEMSDFSIPEIKVSSFTPIRLGCCDWWSVNYLTYITMYVPYGVQSVSSRFTLHRYFVSPREYGCGHNAFCLLWLVLLRLRAPTAWLHTEEANEKKSLSSHTVIWIGLMRQTLVLHSAF